VSAPQFSNLLEISELTVGFNTEHGPVNVLEQISYKVPKGQTIGLVGESGCGKSVSVMSLMRLLPSPPSFVKNGSILFKDRDLLTLSSEEMRKIRGNRIGMIFQEPMTSLNPVFSIGWQMAEVLQIHKNIGVKEAEERCLELLQLIGIGGGRKRLKQYPHELSGGLRQRIMIAMALACAPELLIADEPTTALDVTIQAQILDLLASLQNDLQMSILMITHDLGVVAETCTYVYVMYAGRIIEEAPVRDLFEHPLHPYTSGLMDSRPRLTVNRKWLPTIKGMVPSPQDRVRGCSFAGRCPKAKSICFETEPVLLGYGENHAAACWEVNR